MAKLHTILNSFWSELISICLRAVEVLIRSIVSGAKFWSLFEMNVKPPGAGKLNITSDRRRMCKKSALCFVCIWSDLSIRRHETGTLFEMRMHPWVSHQSKIVALLSFHAEKERPSSTARVGLAAAGLILGLFRQRPCPVFSVLDYTKLGSQKHCQSLFGHVRCFSVWIDASRSPQPFSTWPVHCWVHACLNIAKTLDMWSVHRWVHACLNIAKTLNMWSVHRWVHVCLDIAEALDMWSVRRRVQICCKNFRAFRGHDQHCYLHICYKIAKDFVRMISASLAEQMLLLMSTEPSERFGAWSEHRRVHADVDDFRNSSSFVVQFMSMLVVIGFAVYT